MVTDPLVYLNGKIQEISETRISPFDRGFLWGDGVYEITPCFGGKPFRLNDHIERLYRSLRYVRIDPGLPPKELTAETQRYLDTNQNRLNESVVYRLGHWITRGEDASSMKADAAGPPTIMMFMRPVDVKSIARNYQDGVHLSVSTTRRSPPECMETRAKVTSKMNQILAEIDSASRGALSLMLDLDGNVSENSVANIFIVRDGVLWTPPEKNILEGVTRKVVFEICDQLSIPIEERLFTMYDLAQAEEIFITSSAICAIPVSAVDDFVPLQLVPGQITTKLISAFAAETGFDYRE